MYWIYLAAIGAFIWLVILFLPWRPWDIREVIDSTPACPDFDLSDTTVLIPARNEAKVIASTLSTLSNQGRGLATVVVDGRSTDGTSTVAQTRGIRNLRVIPGEPLPSDWSGKLWALEL